jgi:hypothetical protein
MLQLLKGLACCDETEPADVAAVIAAAVLGQVHHAAAAVGPGLLPQN